MFRDPGGSVVRDFKSDRSARESSNQMLLCDRTTPRRSNDAFYDAFDAACQTRCDKTNDRL